MIKEVMVTWRDEPDVEYLALVAIEEQWVEGEQDDGIFFYFNTQEEFEELLKTGTEEFFMSVV